MLLLRKAAVIASFPLLVLAARFVPFDRLPSTCGFLRLTGYPCPTCGMTRSVMALAHLDWARAMAFNPLGPVFLGMCALWWTNALIEIRTGRRTRLWEWTIRNIVPLAILGIAVLTIFGGLRIRMLAR